MPRSPVCLIRICLALMGLLASGCAAPAGPITLQAVLNPRDPSASYSSSFASSPPGKLRLHAAINETLGFAVQIVSNQRCEQPAVRATPLSSSLSEISREWIQLWRIEPVAVGSYPGWHIRAVPPSQRTDTPLDALLPLGAEGELSVPIRPRRAQFVWVDVHIPKGTPEGVYVGEVQLFSGKQLAGRLEYEVTVWPFVLPDESSIGLIGELNHAVLFGIHADQARLASWVNDAAQPDRRRRVEGALKLLLSHRVSPVLPELAPDVNLDPRGNIQVHWQAYDAIVGDLLDGAFHPQQRPLRYCAAPIRPLLRTAAQSTPLTPQDRFVGQFLEQCGKHFAEQGWIERTYLAVPHERRELNLNFSHEADWVRVFNGLTNRFKVLTAGFPQDMEPFGWVNFRKVELASYVDIWAPPAQFFEEGSMIDQRANGKIVWLSVDRPPFSGTTSIFATASDVRVLSWQARSLGAEALYPGTINRWPESRNVSAADCLAYDDQVLLYPQEAFGTEGPVASLRLKHLRQTMQDAAYYDLLTQHGLSHLAETIQESLVAYAGTSASRTHFGDGREWGWPRDADVFELARELMAQELLAAQTIGPSTQHEEFARSAKWRRFLQQTRSIDVRFEGARARPGSSSEGVRLEVEFSVRNRRRTPVRIEAQMQQLPEGWTDDDEPDEVTLDHGEFRRIRRTIRLQRESLLPGKIRFPLQLVVDNGHRLESQATVAAVTAPLFSERIQVDGDLSDWPAGTVNVLSDFALIAPGPSDAVPPAKPRRRTTAFVMRTQDSLLVAVNCELGPQFARLPTSRKGVRYDDLIPCDEELIEILLDPLNAGTRSPSDLYHIVVKRFGADLVEKGIRTNPPCAVDEPWNARLEIATKTAHDRWMAEVRIPLAALNVRQSGFLGFNITRFNADDQEFSTWSGAVGNAYDPLSLGNLYLPEH